MSTFTTDRILFALFTLSRRGVVIDAGELGRFAGTSALVAAEGLVALEHAGLADASRLRLTLQGLARASQLGAGAADGGWASPQPAAAEQALPARQATRAFTPRRAREPAVVKMSAKAMRSCEGVDTQH